MNKNEFIFDCLKLSISVLAFSGTFKSSQHWPFFVGDLLFLTDAKEGTPYRISFGKKHL